MNLQNPESDFIRTFNELSASYRTRDVWDDFVVMSACALSNPVDKAHYEERESRYLRIIGKYKKQEQQFKEQIPLDILNNIKKLYFFKSL